MDFCSTCLCTDRSLKLLKRLRYAAPLIKLMKLELSVDKDRVCWECEACFAKINNFRKQIFLAQKKMDIWHRSKKLPCILKKNTMKSLTKLTVAKKDEYDEIVSKESGDEKVIEEKVVDDEEYVKDDSIDIDFIEDWDRFEGAELNNGDDDDEIAVLIVDGEEDTTQEDISGKSEDEHFIVDSEMKLTKEEENFLVSRMSKEELYKCRDEDSKATVYKRCQYKCLKCITGYYKEDKFARHLALRHDEVFEGKVRKYSCSICESRFLRLQALKTHYDKHFRRYKCKSCDFNHHKLSAMHMHSIKDHNQGSSHVCRVCGAEFDRRHALHYHLKAVHRDQPQCSICGKVFTTATHLKTHMTIHSAPKNVQCPDCGRWVRESSLAVHRRTHAVHATHAHCEKCGRQFASVAFYKRHVARSGCHQK